MPFVRTLGQAERVTELLAEHGLKRGQDGLQLIMMCEVPSNAILADEFLRVLRRLLDRLQRPDPAHAGPGPRLGPGAAGRRLRRARPGRQGACCSRAIAACTRQGKYVGICGQGPSDHPDFAAVAGGRGHRVDLAQPGQRDRHLAAAGRALASAASERHAASRYRARVACRMRTTLAVPLEWRPPMAGPLQRR